jgi:hypothetical protein
MSRGNCKECGGTGHTECCPLGYPIMWPEQPRCSRCLEPSIEACSECKGTGKEPVL